VPQPTDNKAISALIDKEAIRDVLLKYCHGMDRRDPDVLGTVFWPGAPLEYGMYQGSGSDFATFIIPWFDSTSMSTTAHLIANSLIVLDQEVAHAETYFQAFHRAPNESGVTRDVFVAGRYHDSFSRRSGEWRISRRKVNFDWFRDFGDTGDWSSGTYGVSNDTAYIGSTNEARWAEFRAMLLAGRSVV
jgi:SnoaL-like domain